MSEQVKLRGPTGRDVPLILNSWLKSARDVGDRAVMSNDVYFTGYRLECLEKVTDGQVTIACDPEDDDRIFGWLCWQPGTIHYVYVKRDYRRWGIARQMIKAALPEFGKEPTVTTTLGRFHNEWRRKYGVEYNPYGWRAE